MDLHNPIATPTSFEQENNQILLNAIKNKFAAQTANEASSFSPPKFNIPTLKTLDNGGYNPKVMAVSDMVGKPGNGSNQLNHFLLKQLQEKQTNQDSVKGNAFVLPQLQIGKQISTEAHFEIPLLKSTSSSKVSTLTTAMNKLEVQENENTITCLTATHPASPSIAPAIDLTSALASKMSLQQSTPPTRDFVTKQKQEKHNFEIPFIACDRLDNSTSGKGKSKILVSENEYCLIDISHLACKTPTYNENPSPVGQFLYLVKKRYKPVPAKYIIPTQQSKLSVKHNVQPFLFDTKSPDDKVLESLSKYGKR